MCERSVHVLVDNAVLFIEHSVPLGEQEINKLVAEEEDGGRGGGGVNSVNSGL